MLTCDHIAECVHIALLSAGSYAHCSVHVDGMEGMASSISAHADHPCLVKKAKSWSELCHYFTYIADTQGYPTVTTTFWCKRCFKPVQTEGSHTSNLAKHLTDRYADMLKEFKGLSQVSD